MGAFSLIGKCAVLDTVLAPILLPGATQGERVIVAMGNQRFEVDFYRKLTHLNPEPAPVVPMKRRTGRRRPTKPQ